MIIGLEHLESDLEIAEYLQNTLITHATGGVGENVHYKQI